MMSVCVFIASKLLSTSMMNAQDLHGFAFLTYDHLFVPRERRIYIFQGRYDALIKDEREKQSFFFDPFGRLEDGSNLQRESSRLNTLRGNVAYYFSQLRKQLWIVTRVWNFNAKTFERAIRTEADPYARFKLYPPKSRGWKYIFSKIYILDKNNITFIAK